MTGRREIFLGGETVGTGRISAFQTTSRQMRTIGLRGSCIFFAYFVK